MFIVIELQTNSEGQVSSLVYPYEDENEAMSKYHAVLSVAATSALPKHACCIITDEGFYLKHECFKHPAQ